MLLRKTFAADVTVCVVCAGRMRLLDFATTREEVARALWRAGLGPQPPLAQDRLSQLPDGQLSYVMKKAWKDGTHALVFDPQSFIGQGCCSYLPGLNFEHPRAGTEGISRIMTLSFTLRAIDPNSRARRGSLSTQHGRVETPAFMAVGTRATVTGLTPADLRGLGAQVVLANTYHLMLRPGPELFRRVGGIHQFMGWSGPVLTDSGGYQIFSLAGDRTIDEQGARFKSYVDQRTHLLSPEASIAIQTAIGSDIMMVLDECIDSSSDVAATRAAMERTHRWALRSLAARTAAEQALFAIVQGGVLGDLRRESVAFLTQQPFDGFALGGLAVGDTRSQREHITQMTAELLPADRPRYLMGVGTPPDLLFAMLCGVDMFDCVLPTHLAWQGSAFTSTGRVRITRGANASADIPLDAACSCTTCTTFSRSYLHHLFKCSEPLGPRLLSLHNLFHYHALMAEARAAIEAGCFAAHAKQKLAEIDRHEHSERRLGLAAAE